MLNRYRLLDTALGAGLILVILAFGMVLHESREKNGPHNDTQTSAQQNQGGATTSLPVQQDQPAPNQTPCDYPQTTEQHELCQQWRMANATDEQARWVFPIFAVTVIEIGLLIIIVGMTVRATNAAVQANGIARDTAKKQLRAYVLPTGVGFSEDHAGRLKIVIKFKNTGQTPARNFRSKTRAGFAPDTYRDFNHTLDRAVSSEIGPGELTSGLFLQPTGNDFVDSSRDITSGNIVFYVFGRAAYRDIFSDEHTVDFRFRYSPEQQDFVICDEGNEAT